MNMKSLHTQQQIEDALFDLLQKSLIQRSPLQRSPVKLTFLGLLFIAIMSKKMKLSPNFWLNNTVSSLPILTSII